MFGLILGYGAPTQAVPTQGPRQKGTRADAERRHPASARGVAGVGVAAAGCGHQRSESIPDGTVRAAGDPDHRQTISTTWPGAGIVREKADGACGTAGFLRQATDYRHGLQPAAGGTSALDGALDRRGSREAETGPRCGPGNDSDLAPKPRLQAVAGKKCGAWPNSMRNISPRWKMSWRCMRSPTKLPNP